MFVEGGETSVGGGELVEGKGELVVGEIGCNGEWIVSDGKALRVNENDHTKVSSIRSYYIAGWEEHSKLLTISYTEKMHVKMQTRGICGPLLDKLKKTTKQR